MLYVVFWQQSRGWLLFPLSDMLLLIMSVCVQEFVFATKEEFK